MKFSLKNVVRAGAVALAVSVGSVGSVGWAAEPPIWLMGEVHDNAQGHFYRLKDLESMLGSTWRPALLMEQFDTDRQDALTKAWQTCKTADCVIQAAGGQGWDWPLYEPLIALALKYQLPMVAANLSREQVRSVMQKGFGAVFDAKTIKQYRLDQPLPQPWLDGQRQAIDLGHCKMLPPPMVDAMVNGQAARDVVFAQLVEQYASQGVVLVAGNGHVRRDLGVYQWLPADLRSRVTIAGYVEPAGLDQRLYDRVRLVEEQARLDPCVTFKSSRRQ